MSIAINNLERALLSLDQTTSEKIIFEEIAKGSVSKTAGNLISETLKRIGDLWEKNQLSLSQVYTSGVICEKIINKILLPQEPFRLHQPKMAIGVFEDFHLLGKRIVFSTLRASGYDLLDLGGGLTIDDIVTVVKNEKIEILLISVLMLPSALRIKNLKKRLAGFDVKIVVGGAPFRFDNNLWKEVGADYYGNDSAEALEIVEKLIGEFV